MCLRWKFQIKTEAMVTSPWTENLYQWCRGISYGSLGACHIWRIVLEKSGIHFGWHHVGMKSYGGKKILEGDLTLEDTME